MRIASKAGLSRVKTDQPITKRQKLFIAMSGCREADAPTTGTRRPSPASRHCAILRYDILRCDPDEILRNKHSRTCPLRIIPSSSAPSSTAASAPAESTNCRNDLQSQPSGSDWSARVWKDESGEESNPADRQAGTLCQRPNDDLGLRSCRASPEILFRSHPMGSQQGCSPVIQRPADDDDQPRDRRH